jgi:hypothetical protein
MLLLDRHSSHVTPKFRDYCAQNRILLAVLPPHSSHRLQPLNVGMFKPLSTRYTNKLNFFLQRSSRLLNVRKSDFLRLFWAAFTSSFTTNNILSSFAATGVSPPNAEVVLKHLQIPTPRRNTDTEIGYNSDGDTYRHVAYLVNNTVADSLTV